jgi:hypothetical protein
MLVETVPIYGDVCASPDTSLAQDLIMQHCNNHVPLFDSQQSAHSPAWQLSAAPSSHILQIFASVSKSIWPVTWYQEFE